MAFVRFAGCNLKCRFCDTNYEETLVAPPEQIFTRVLKVAPPVRRVVLTGGEPCMQDLTGLIEWFKNWEFRVHIETNGTLPIPKVDWITWSPKNIGTKPPERVDEIKFLCGIEGWQDVIRWVIEDTTLMPCRMYLQPVDLEENVSIAYNYCLDHPFLTYSCQIHKYIKVK